MIGRWRTRLLALQAAIPAGAIATALGQCERAVSFFTEATRQGTSYLAYWENPLLAPIAECAAFKRFMKPKD